MRAGTSREREDVAVIKLVHLALRRRQSIVFFKRDGSRRNRIVENVCLFGCFLTKRFANSRTMSLSDKRADYAAYKQAHRIRKP